MLVMEMSNKKQQIPAIRFNGFTDAWEQRKLIDVADIFGGGTPSTTISDYWDGEIDWYSPVEIGEQVYVNGSQKKLTELGLKKSSAKVLPVGTVLFTSRAGIGKTAILAKEGATNQGFQSIVPHKNTLDSYFIYSRTNELKHYGEIQGAGSTFVEVSGKQMAKMPILIPILEEQTKIGAFFKKLDDTIALHQRQLNKFNKMKKTMLQKMFPQNGEKFPEIRFDGFTKEWNERKLIDVADIYDNLRVPVTASDRVKGNIPYYGANGIQDYVEGFTHDGEFILIAEDGANDLVNYPENYVNGKVWVNNHAHVVSGKKESLDNLFLASRIRSMNISTWLVGGGRAKLNGEVLKKIPLMIPSLEEQTKIGDFFKQLDGTIVLHQQKIRNYQEIKKVMLQQMFV